MIYVCKEKQLNDFKPVRCVKPKDLYSRLGHRVPDTNFTSSDDPLPISMHKIDQIEYLENYDRMMAQSESTVNDSSANHQSNDDSSVES